MKILLLGPAHQYRRFNNIDRLGNVVNIPYKLNYKEALKGNSIGCLTVCIDKSKIKPFLMPQQRHEDYITWLNILKENKVIAYGLQDDLARYRIGTKESVSANKFKSAIWTWKVYRNSQKLSILQSIYYIFLYLQQGFKKHIFSFK